jgi:hypothetical protein
MSLLMQLLVFLGQCAQPHPCLGLFGNLTLPVTSVYFLSSLFLHLSYVILTACLLFPQCLCFARFFRLKNSSLDGGKEEKEAVEG